MAEDKEKEKAEKTPDTTLVTFVKPGGQEVQVNSNPANLAEAKRLGWKKKGSK